jgi:hypothetical protein
MTIWKKENLIVILIILVAIPVSFIYDSFNGNPIGKYMARQKMADYLETHYPQQAFKIDRVYYDFKFGGYTGSISSPRDPSIRFMLHTRNHGEIYDQYIDKYAKDQALSQRFSEQVSQLVLTAAKDQVEETSKVSADIYIKKGKYAPTTNYSPEMEEHFTADIRFTGRKISADDFLERSIAVRDAVLAKGFKVDEFGFDYEWGIKGEGYSLGIPREQLTASKQQLRSHLVNYEKFNASKR